MLECDTDVLGADLIELLMIAADVLAAQGANVRVHDLAGKLETVFQPDRIAFRPKPAQEFRLKAFQRLQVPRFQ